jgi:pimeloyl-ACP methyl ester carboxylesterase
MAYRIRRGGPPLVLVMGYRLSSVAWPTSFVEALARQFTVITPDNRGTGLSDKPVDGYALANMARDIQGLLDELGIPKVHMLGYSMGGAIAQEFVRQFPDRVQNLILCATMCGGARATYAKPSVTRLMREIDGMSPVQIARRIWRVAYAPAYLERHQALAEDQTQRELAFPTPLHSADLQFQAFAEGHRVLWETPDECIDVIREFLRSPPDCPTASLSAEAREEHASAAAAILASTMESLATLPLALMRAGFDSLAIFRQSMMVGTASRFGDGKPLVLVPQLPASDLSLAPLSMWLKALGYRPVTASRFVSMETPSSDRSLSQTIRDITRRVGRKAILITHSASMTRVLAAARSNRDLVSDVIVFDARQRPSTDGLRVHFLSSGWPLLHGMVELPQLLRSIGIELIEGLDWTDTPHSSARRLSEGER